MNQGSNVSPRGKRKIHALALNRKKLLVRTSKLRKAQLTRASFAGAKLAQSKNAGKKSRDHHRGDDRELLGVQPLVRANGLEPRNARF